MKKFLKMVKLLNKNNSKIIRKKKKLKFLILNSKIPKNRDITQ